MHEDIERNLLWNVADAARALYNNMLDADETTHPTTGRVYKDVAALQKSLKALDRYTEKIAKED